MAKVTIKEFEAVLRADEALRQKYEEAFKAVTEVSNDGEAMQKAAAKLGYEISLEELEQAWAAAQELDSAELDAVAGGQSLHSQFCFLVWFCHMVTMHTDVSDEEHHNEECWSNYYCVTVNH